MCSDTNLLNYRPKVKQNETMGAAILYAGGETKNKIWGGIWKEHAVRKLLIKDKEKQEHVDLLKISKLGKFTCN